MNDFSIYRFLLNTDFKWYQGVGKVHSLSGKFNTYQYYTSKHHIKKYQYESHRCFPKYLTYRLYYK